MPEKRGSVNWYIQVNTERPSPAVPERIHTNVNPPRMAAVPRRDGECPAGVGTQIRMAGIIKNQARRDCSRRAPLLHSGQPMVDQ